MDLSGGYRLTTQSGKEVRIDGGYAFFEPDERDMPPSSGRVQEIYLQTSLRF